MSNALKGILILLAISHFMLIVIPVLNTLYASISKKSKMFWCAFLNDLMMEWSNYNGMQPANSDNLRQA